MAHDLRLSNETVNAEAEAFSPLANSGYLRIYTVGSGRPATADTAITDQVLLAELRMNAAAFGAASNGVLTAAAITGEDAALATGTAAFYRLLKSNGTAALCDGEVGVSGGGSDLELVGTTTITIGLPVNVTSFTHTVTKQ
jgi:hypothetical protein